MARFNYQETLISLMVPEIQTAVGAIREQRGRQSLFKETQPATLDKLCEVAKIQSIGASNRIENISTSDKRLHELARQKTKPKNRDEREILGYRYVLTMIHENHDDIAVTPNNILQLHRDLYRYIDAPYAGKWKDVDNTIGERLASGELVTRFKPTLAAQTPEAIRQICEAYNKEIQESRFDSLLTSLVFIFDFVCIHPFNDGNGRMSRLLMLLLLYRNGFEVGKYISIEAEIEKTKETYYEALRESSHGWSEGKNDYVPLSHHGTKNY